MYKMSLVCVNDYENYAKQKISNKYFNFFEGGAGAERTVKWNKDSYAKYRIRPKYMRKITNRSMSRNILGKPVSIPIGISPTACQKIAHPDGEAATARAAEALGAIMILSSHSNTSLEEIAKAAPNARKWLQLYIFEERSVTEDLIKTAELAGFEGIVLTLDFALFGLRRGQLRNKFEPPPDTRMAVLEKYHKQNLLKDFVGFSDPNADWDYIKWLKTKTSLSIIAKGVLTAEDANLAVHAGADAILVSNHGGRQLDSLPATIEALPEVVKAVGHQVDVYVDGGIRDGTDIFKALALGAKMVFVGRPVVWGLIHSGAEGVKNILTILKNELDNAMGIAGCTNLNEIPTNMVVHESYYNKL